MIRRTVAVLVGGIGCLMVASACGPGKSAEAGPAGRWIVALSDGTTAAASPWHDQLVCSIKVQARKSGKVVQLVRLGRKITTSGEQAQEISDLVAQSGVNAIIVDASDPTHLNAAIDDAMGKGVVVVAVDHTVTAPRAYRVGTDNAAAGRLAATWLAARMQGTGTVLAFVRGETDQVDGDRARSLTRALSPYPSMTVTTVVVVSDPTSAAVPIRTALNDQPFDAIWAPPGLDWVAVDALAAVGRLGTVPVVGSTTNEFLRQLLAGPTSGLVGAAVSDPAVMGAAAVDTALTVLSGQTSGHDIVIAPQRLDIASGSERIRAANRLDRGKSSPTETDLAPYTTFTADELLTCLGPKETPS